MSRCFGQDKAWWPSTYIATRWSHSATAPRRRWILNQNRDGTDITLAASITHEIATSPLQSVEKGTELGTWCSRIRSLTCIAYSGVALAAARVCAGVNEAFFAARFGSESRVVNEEEGKVADAYINGMASPLCLGLHTNTCTASKMRRPRLKKTNKKGLDLNRSELNQICTA